jgi:NAD(P)-dependent dehydrogenase (short-subunit alcohol dehydrogenase family)
MIQFQKLSTRAILTSLVAVFYAIPLGVFHVDLVQADSHEPDSQKAILVTGASSGIGLNMTQTLAAEGYFIYAGARKQKDLDALNAIENVQAIRLDVTSQAEIDAAVETVRAGGLGLHGLVNNAGVAVISPLIEVEEQDLQFQMDVNVFGPYRVTKAFAPLIMESKGRITTIGSISGILSGALAGPYSMSKHAVEAYTDSLATEMARFDVAVSVIEPGNYQSSMSRNVKDRMEERGITAEGSLFQEEMEGLVKMIGSDQSSQKEPDEVTDAVRHALFDDNPKRRYMVVPNERQADATIRQILRETVQLNERQEYTYDREKLISILDEVLAELK